MTTKRTIRLTLAITGDDDQHLVRKLRAALKFLLRIWGFRCITATWDAADNSGPPATPDPSLRYPPHSHAQESPSAPLTMKIAANPPAKGGIPHCVLGESEAG